MLPLSRPLLDPNTTIDFYAGSLRAMELMLPVWKSLPESRRGTFYTRDVMKDPRQTTQVLPGSLPGCNPLVVSSPADLTPVFYSGDERVFIFLEAEHHKATRGLLATVGLFLCPDEKVHKIRKAFSEKYQEVQIFQSAQQAADLMVSYVKGKEPTHISEFQGHSIGMIYMAFGPKAANAVQRSVATLRRVGYSFPVCVVGDTPVPNMQFVSWKGISPFDPTQKKNFRFRAGRVKPLLYGLSPFDYTLYLDADTEFLQNPVTGFEYLLEHDLVLTQEYLTVGQLYNKFQAGWEINIEERDYTIESGISSEEPFVNSGVYFFRKSPANKRTFRKWHEEWMRFQQWDEQLALMRAVHQTKPTCKYLDPRWNDPHVHSDTIIFHNYGRGNVRHN